jgi:hypothetical protein
MDAMSDPLRQAVRQRASSTTREQIRLMLGAQNGISGWRYERKTERRVKFSVLIITKISSYLFCV